MQVGMVGLGRMGANMVRRLLKGGHECVVFNRSPKPVEELVREKAVGATSLKELVSKLKKPRAVWLMVPAAIVDEMIASVVQDLDPGDILIDGGNSYYIDDIRRAKELAPRQVHFVDVGTSGGIWGLERGYCMMIGGEDRGDQIPRSHPCNAGSRYGQHLSHTWPRKDRRHSRTGLPALRAERRRPFRQNGSQRNRVRLDGGLR